MSGEMRDLPIVAPQEYHHETPPICPPPADAAAVRPMAPPNPEQVRAVEAAFGHTDENERVAALLGLWTGAMLLHDLAQDALEEPNLSDPEPNRKPAPEDDVGE